MRTKMKNRMLAFVAVVLMLAIAAVPLSLSDDDCSDAAGSYYSYTLNYTSGAISYGTGLTDKTPVSSYSSTYGSWGFDSDGYGPFGSFYAIFGSDGTMLGHLNPSNLSKYMDGTSAPITSSNVMWCLPTVYWLSTATTLTLTNDPSAGGTAYAHTVDGYVYKYIGLGVFEATNSNGTLMSVSGTTPTVSQTRATFRDQADNNVVDGGHAMLWNFYQWELYKYCTYAVTGTFNSQNAVGMGNASGSGPSTTGGMNSSGPYNGTSSSSQTGVKCFIENGWGSVWDFVDDVVVNGTSGFYVGQRSAVNDMTFSMSYVQAALPSSDYPSAVHTDARIWGFGSAGGGSSSSGLCDYLYTSSSAERSLIVGGIWNYGDAAGVGCAGANVSLGFSGSNVGARLAYVFDADPASSKTVTFSSNGSVYNQMSVSSGATIGSYPADPTLEGFAFGGWFVDSACTTAHNITTPVTANITLYAKWNDTLAFTSAPSAAINVSIIGDTGRSAIFDASSSKDYVTVKWDFGDGTTAANVYSKHVYENEGTYEVTLTVTGADGTSSSTTRSVTVYNDPQPSSSSGNGLNYAGIALTVLTAIAAVVLFVLGYRIPAVVAAILAVAPLLWAVGVI